MTMRNRNDLRNALKFILRHIPVALSCCQGTIHTCDHFSGRPNIALRREIKASCFYTDRPVYFEGTHQRRHTSAKEEEEPGTLVPATSRAKSSF